MLFARGKTGKVKNDAMPPKVGRVTSDGKRVFEPSHNDSPLGQNMDEPWADGPPAYIMDDSHVSRRCVYMVPQNRSRFHPMYHQTTRTEDARGAQAMYVQHF